MKSVLILEQCCVMFSEELWGKLCLRPIKSELGNQPPNGKPLLHAILLIVAGMNRILIVYL